MSGDHKSVFNKKKNRPKIRQSLKRTLILNIKFIGFIVLDLKPFFVVLYLNEIGRLYFPFPLFRIVDINLLME